MGIVQVFIVLAVIYCIAKIWSLSNKVNDLQRIVNKWYADDKTVSDTKLSDIQSHDDQSLWLGELKNDQHIYMSEQNNTPEQSIIRYWTNDTIDEKPHLHDPKKPHHVDDSKPYTNEAKPYGISSSQQHPLRVRMSDNRPVKVWSLLILLWIGWLMTYAIINNRISDLVKIILGLVSGWLIMYVWDRTLPRYGTPSHILIWLGSWVISLILILAYTLYARDSSYVIVWLIIQYIYSAYLAHKHTNQRLFALSYIYSVITPLWLDAWNVSILRFVGVMSSVTACFASMMGWKYTRYIGLWASAVYWVYFWINWSLPALSLPVLGTLVVYLWYQLYEMRTQTNRKLYTENGFTALSYVAYIIIFPSQFFINVVLLLLLAWVYVYLWLQNLQKQEFAHYLMYMYWLIVLSITYLSFSWSILTIWYILIVSWLIGVSIFTMRSERYVWLLSILHIIPLISLYIESVRMYNTQWFDWLVLLLIVYAWALQCVSILSKKYINPMSNIGRVYDILSVFMIVCSIWLHFDWSLRIIMYQALVIVVLWLYYTFRSPWFGISSTLPMTLIPLLLLATGYERVLDIPVFLMYMWVVGLCVAHYFIHDKKYTLFVWALWLIALYDGLAHLIPHDYLAIAYGIIGTILYWFVPQVRSVGLWGIAVAVAMTTSHLLWNSVSDLMTLLMSWLLCIVLRHIHQKSDYQSIYDYGYFGAMCMYVWLFVRKIADMYTEQAMIWTLIIYTIIWLYFFITHHSQEQKNIWTAIILWVILRIFTVELWTMSLIAKIITCLIVWALLISSWFINKKHLVPKE